MRTKHILAALAIPAFLAACSSEEDFTLNNTPDLAGRKVINADLVFDFNQYANTRLAIGDDAITLDDQDKVAAALIDEVTDNSTTQTNGYYITDGIATNHPFTKSATGWNTPTALVEGNYLFYYQYNEGLGGSRKTAVPYSIGKTQYAYTKDAPTVFAGDQAVKDNAMGIGYAFLGAEDGVTPSQVKVQMYNLFAFLKFNISTDKAGLEVQQILVKRTGTARFKLTGTIDNSKVAAEGVKTADGKSESANNPKNAGVLVKAGAEKITADYATEDSQEEDYVILSLPDLKASSTKQAAYVVIPAADYTSSDDSNPAADQSSEFIVDVYTNQGVFTRTVELSKAGADSKDDYATLTMGKVQQIGLNITGTLKAAEKYFVGSAEQWQKVLKSLPAVAANASAAQKALAIEVLNDVKLTKADIDLIQSTNAKDYTITISGSPLILTESCALSNIKIDKLNVNSAVTLDLGNKAVITTLNNAGTVNINAVGSKETVASITTLNNNGVANVKAAATIATLTNGKTAVAKVDNSAVKLNVKADLTVGTALTNNAGEKAEGNATVTVDEDATLKVIGTNNGTIDNSGQIIANGAFTSTGEKALINNKATGILTNLNGTGNEVKNLGGANIIAASNSTTIVADNTASTITYADGANVSVTGASEKKGKIAYVITDKYLVPTVKVEYNTIVVDGLSVKLNTATDNDTAFDMPSTTGITNVVIKNGATVDMSMQNAELTLIEVAGSNNKIITAAGGTSTAALNVSIKSYLLIPLNSKVTATKLVSEGSINVGGTLIFTSSGSTEGTLLGTGTITKN